MKTFYLFLADGFEEVEALSTVDLLRRAGLDIKTVSIKDGLMVTGAHGIKVESDITMSQVGEIAVEDWLILPGGMPGATNLKADERLCKMLVDHNQKGGMLAAICASPAVVLGQMGLLKGKSAVCYPGFESMMDGAKVESTPVAVDENVVTGNGPAAATAFALTIIENALGIDAADGVAEGMLLKDRVKTSEYYF